MALAHNGNLVNAQIIRSKLEEDGAIFQTTVDTEVMAYLIAKSKTDDIVEAIKRMMKVVKGAYSLVIATPNALIAVRIPRGFGRWRWVSWTIILSSHPNPARLTPSMQSLSGMCGQGKSSSLMKRVSIPTRRTWQTIQRFVFLNMSTLPARTRISMVSAYIAPGRIWAGGLRRLSRWTRIRGRCSGFRDACGYWICGRIWRAL